MMQIAIATRPKDLLLQYSQFNNMPMHLAQADFTGA
jgi:hypothetical protein